MFIASGPNALIRVDGRFQKHLRLVIGRYTGEVGILQDKPHKNAVSGSIKSFAGGPARRTGRKASDTLSGVSKSIRAQTGINIYTAPFRNKKNREILRFAQEFLKRLIRPGQVSQRRVENLLQAIVRNPILRGDYGRNTRTTAKRKGFNRFMIDTAQFFKGIRARVVRRVSK